MASTWAPQRDIPALVFTLTFPSVMSFLYFVVFGGAAESSEPSRTVQMLYAVGKAIQFTFPAVYLLIFERQRLRLVRPTLRGLGLGLGFGVLVGLAIVGVYFGGLADSAAFAQTPEKVYQFVQKMGLATPGQFLLLAIFMSVPHSLLEEYYWRWFVFGGLRRGLPVGAAIAISAVGFTAHHVVLLGVYFPGRFWTVAVPLSAGVGIGGAVWAWIYNRTGSLYAPWLSHALVDSAIMVVGYAMLVRFWQL
jgi:membrane protease YdiL (CAAX protease family)